MSKLDFLFGRKNKPISKRDEPSFSEVEDHYISMESQSKRQKTHRFDPTPYPKTTDLPRMREHPMLKGMPALSSSFFSDAADSPLKVADEFLEHSNRAVFEEAALGSLKPANKDFEFDYPLKKSDAGHSAPFQESQGSHSSFSRSAPGSYQSQEQGDSLENKVSSHPSSGPFSHEDRQAAPLHASNLTSSFRAGAGNERRAFDKAPSASAFEAMPREFVQRAPAYRPNVSPAHPGTREFMGPTPPSAQARDPYDYSVPFDAEGPHVGRSRGEVYYENFPHHPSSFDYSPQANAYHHPQMPPEHYMSSYRQDELTHRRGEQVRGNGRGPFYVAEGAHRTDPIDPYYGAQNFTSVPPSYDPRTAQNSQSYGVHPEASYYSSPSISSPMAHAPIYQDAYGDGRGHNRSQDFQHSEYMRKEDDRNFSHYGAGGGPSMQEYQAPYDSAEMEGYGSESPYPLHETGYERPFHPHHPSHMPYPAVSKGKRAFLQSDFTNAPYDEKFQGSFRLIVSITGLVVLIGATWIAYRWISQPKQNTPIVISASKEPFKVRPDHPGGTNFPYQDKLVYDRLLPQQEQAQDVEHLLPDPEAITIQPLTPPSDFAPESHQNPAASSHDMLTPQVGVQNIPMNEHSVKEASQHSAFAAPVENDMAQNPATKITSSAPDQVKKNPEIAQIQMTPSQDLASAANFASTAILNEKYTLQFATLSSESKAIIEKKRLSKKYKKVLKGALQVKSIVLNDNKVVYRVIAQDIYDSKQHAIEACAKIGQACKVIKNPS